MRTRTTRITVNDLVIDVVRKNIKNLHLTVCPPDGRLRISAPFRATDDTIRLAIVSRLPWIKRHQAKFLAAERQPARQYVSGESHLFQGTRYLLSVVPHEGRPGVVVRGNATLDLFVRAESDPSQPERVLLAWYRQQLKLVVPPLIDKWQNATGLQISEWRIKHMKTKWGTCNIRARRIWLNLELVKKPVHCLEYVIVHELVHLLERRHDARFAACMDKFMPQWRLHRAELNRAPLGHANLGY